MFGAYLGGKNPTGERIPYRIAASAMQLSESTISRYVEGITVPTWPDRWVIEAWTNGYVDPRKWCDQAEVLRLHLASNIRPFATARGRIKKAKSQKRART